MKNKDKKILHLCADLGTDSAPYREAGYNVITVGQQTDVRFYQPPKDVYGIIANPPCTFFSLARTNAKEPRDLRGGMELVEACLRIIWECQYRIKSDVQKSSPLKFWALENPGSGMLKYFLGKPALIYNPWEYGEKYQKKTALWGMFNDPKPTGVLHPKPVKFDKLLSHEIAPEYFGKLTRTERRSVCSKNFAKAFFEANQ